MRSIITIIRLSIVISWLLLPHLILGQWSQDYKNNLQLHNSGFSQSIVNDQKGGFYLGFHEYGCFDCNYVTYIDKYGYPVWDSPLNIMGVEAANENLEIILSSDNQLIVAFTDQILYHFDGIRYHWKYKLVIQKFDSTGSSTWNDDNIYVSTDSSDQYDYEIISDDSGGVFISWTAEQSLYDSIYRDRKRYIQHISSSGERLWGDNGKLILDDSGTYDSFRLYYDNINEHLFVIGVPFEGEFYLQCWSREGILVWSTPMPFFFVSSSFL